VRSSPRPGATGFTLIELLIVVGIIGIVAAVAVPGLLRARISANEASAIGSLRAINSAEAAYASSAGNVGHATQLARLAVPCPGTAQGFISPDLGVDPATKDGYTISLAPDADGEPGPDDCNGAATETGYYATAAPISPSSAFRPEACRWPASATRARSGRVTWCSPSRGWATTARGWPSAR